MEGTTDERKHTHTKVEILRDNWKLVHCFSSTGTSYSKKQSCYKLLLLSQNPPWYLPKGVENSCLNKTCQSLHIAALLVIAKTWKKQEIIPQ